jgi:hypothetical protein
VAETGSGFGYTVHVLDPIWRYRRRWGLAMIEPGATDSARCVCCDRPFAGHDHAMCTTCGKAFHLAMRVDVPVEECGQVWINETLEALEFGCNRCLEAAGLIPPAKPRRRYAQIERHRPSSARRSGPSSPSRGDRDAI